MSVLVHIGLFKTGTTSLQRFLRDHEDSLLAPHGARFPVGWLRRDCHLELSMGLMRPDRLDSARLHGDEWHSAAWRAGLVAQVRDDLDAHRDWLTVLSAEHLSLLRHDDELDPLRRLLGDEVTVVVYLRERDAFLASLTDQLVKNGIAPSTERDSFAYVAPDSWRADHEATLEIWRRHFDDVRPYDYDAVTAWDGSVIPSFMRLLGVRDRELADVGAYWLNRRGATDPRVPGARAAGGRFGSPSPLPPPSRGAGDGGPARGVRAPATAGGPPSYPPAGP